MYGTTAEGLDVKEGTTAGIARGNVFGGDALAGADSWVDAKGNEWRFEGNTGIGSPQDGFQMHEILDGWGTGNVFVGNVARVDGPGLRLRHDEHDRQHRSLRQRGGRRGGRVRRRRLHPVMSHRRVAFVAMRLRLRVRGLHRGDG